MVVMRGGTEAGRPRRAVCVSYHCESNCLLLHQGFTCYCRENGYGYSSEVVVFSRSRRSGSEPPADYCITIISRSIFAAIAALLIRISICLPLSPPALLTPSCLRCQEPLGQDVAPSGTGHATVSLCEDCQWYGHERRCFLSEVFKDCTWGSGSIGLRYHQPCIQARLGRRKARVLIPATAGFTWL